MLRRLAALPVSVAGLLFAHETAYRLVAENDRHRHALLDATGHGWLGLAPTLLVLVALVALTQSWNRAAGNGRLPRFAEILGVQAFSYTAIEIGERLVTGQSPWPGLELLAAGAFVQLPAAFLVWALFRFIIDPIIASVRAARHPVEIHERRAQLFTGADSNFFSIPSRSTAGRGPPSFC
jgi:hypothetical protein